MSLYQSVGSPTYVLGRQTQARNRGGLRSKPVGITEWISAVENNTAGRKIALPAYNIKNQTVPAVYAWNGNNSNSNDNIHGAKSANYPSASTATHIASALLNNRTASELVLQCGANGGMGGLSTWHPTEMLQLFNALTEMRSLTVLDSSGVSPAVASLMPEMLIAPSQCLTRLDLSHVRLNADTCAALGASVVHHPSLRHLFLSQCGINNKMLMCFTDAFTKTSSARHVRPSDFVDNNSTVSSYVRRQLKNHLIRSNQAESSAQDASISRENSESGLMMQPSSEKTNKPRRRLTFSDGGDAMSSPPTHKLPGMDHALGTGRRYTESDDIDLAASPRPPRTNEVQNTIENDANSTFQPERQHTTSDGVIACPSSEYTGAERGGETRGVGRPAKSEEICDVADSTTTRLFPLCSLNLRQNSISDPTPLVMLLASSASIGLQLLNVAGNPLTHNHIVQLQDLLSTTGGRVVSNHQTSYQAPNASLDAAPQLSQRQKSPLLHLPTLKSILDNDAQHAPAVGCSALDLLCIAVL